MIITRDLIAEELLTTFKVIKVHYEPYAESVWTLQFEDYPLIEYFDKCFDTIEEDMKLCGKKIRAQIDLQVRDRNVHLVTDPEQQEKSLFYDEEESYFTATGIYFEDSREVEPKYDSNYIQSCIDSLFKIQIGANLNKDPFNFKKGAWVRVKTYERNIIIDRKYLLVD